jgi:hypothetical protein
MPYRTLEDLRGELRVRLGFGAAGGVPGVNQSLLDSFLRSAQDELYWQGSWAEIRSREDLSIGLGQTLVNYPSDCNPQRIEDIYVQVGTTWMPVIEGIDKELYTTVDSQSYPTRYERLDQLEFYPEADQSYTIRVWYYKNLLRFTQDADVATLNDSIIFARALAMAKAHYRHPDAEISNTSATTMINGAKGGAWRQKVFKPKDSRDLPIPKPRTV